MIFNRKRTPATVAIVAAILAGFLFEVVTGAWTDLAKLAAYGSIIPNLGARGEYWRLVTAMFLHGNGTIPGTILHLLVNLISLIQLGSLYEVMFGTRRFVFIYFVAGIVASITSWMHITGSSAGASGAIFGVLGAFVFSVRRSPRWRNERAARGLVAQCVFWIIANLMIGFQIEVIDNAAHIGGLVTGLLLGAILPHDVPPPPPASAVVDVSALPRD